MAVDTDRLHDRVYLNNCCCVSGLLNCLRRSISASISRSNAFARCRAIPSRLRKYFFCHSRISATLLKNSSSFIIVCVLRRAYVRRINPAHYTTRGGYTSMIAISGATSLICANCSSMAVFRIVSSDSFAPADNSANETSRPSTRAKNSTSMFSAA